MPDFHSPLEAFLYWEAKAPKNIFLKQPIHGKIKTYSFAEAGEEARKIASAIQSYHLPNRSHVAILSNNCAHWMMADIAIMMAGHVSIPIYPTLNDASIKQILEHSETKAIIVGKLENFETQKSGIPKMPMISVGMFGRYEGDLWEDLVQKHSPLQDVYIPKHDDLHTIIYTSGTTGNPKGVMHTVNNFAESSKTFREVMQLQEHIRMFSYLPLAHVAERAMCNSGITLGASISFVESLETFAKNLEDTQPHIFFAVPRIWTKFRDKILDSMPQKKLNILLNIPILNSIVKNKLRQKLGLKEAVFIVSAAAPIASSLVKWYRKLGIVIHQGYGMTEDCCVSHFNTPQASKIGTVGKPLMGVKAKLSAEGEICLLNNCLMVGYYKNPEATADVFDEESYLKTGDIGEYDHDGFLTITGRVKDQFKTDKGKYISPSHIELMLSSNTDIEQICIVGTGIPQPIALITLSETGKIKLKAQLVEGLIATVNSINPNLEKHEKVEKVIIMKEDWNVANGLTTPSLKVKRNSIEKIHQEFYKEWFESTDKVIFE
ncbi:AMP-binding protein [Formosa maritima]|uniref:AMP-binding protein n=1 Tax=Formosa maritima TaxID=2592046 RepID=A0A5D0GBE7_9FLAO|nr:AMP-binding protein [Formosa maritima]TYA56031.1 AMP-binding protein [Formosa maritima]